MSRRNKITIVGAGNVGATDVTAHRPELSEDSLTRLARVAAMAERPCEQREHPERVAEPLPRD